MSGGASTGSLLLKAAVEAYLLRDIGRDHLSGLQDYALDRLELPTEAERNALLANLFLRPSIKICHHQSIGPIGTKLYETVVNHDVTPRKPRYSFNIFHDYWIKHRFFAEVISEDIEWVFDTKGGVHLGEAKSILADIRPEDRTAIQSFFKNTMKDFRIDSHLAMIQRWLFLFDRLGPQMPDQMSLIPADARKFRSIDGFDEALASADLSRPFQCSNSIGCDYVEYALSHCITGMANRISWELDNIYTIKGEHDVVAAETTAATPIDGVAFSAQTSDVDILMTITDELGTVPCGSNPHETLELRATTEGRALAAYANELLAEVEGGHVQSASALRRKIDKRIADYKAMVRKRDGHALLRDAALLASGVLSLVPLIGTAFGTINLFASTVDFIEKRAFVRTNKGYEWINFRGRKYNGD